MTLALHLQLDQHKLFRHIGGQNRWDAKSLLFTVSAAGVEEAAVRLVLRRVPINQEEEVVGVEVLILAIITTHQGFPLS